MKQLDSLTTQACINLDPVFETAGREAYSAAISCLKNKGYKIESINPTDFVVATETILSNYDCLVEQEKQNIKKNKT